MADIALHTLLHLVKITEMLFWAWVLYLLFFR